MAIGSTAAQLFVTVGADTSDAQAGLLGLSGTLNSLASDWAKTGSLMTAGLSVPLAGLGLSAVKTASDYQSSMNMFQAVTGASGDEMAKAGDLAKQLGGDMTLPATSAGDAATAMTELAKGGLSVQDSMDAARGTLQLAAAGNIDVGQAADIAANALNTFGLKGSEATRVADLLAATANSSTAEMGDLAYGVQAGGAVFASAGVPLNDYLTSLGELSNAGLKGQDAGTSLKSMLLALEHPTKKAQEAMAALGFSVYDADGKMRPWRDIIGNLQSSLGGLTQQQRDAAMATIFGSDGVRAATILMRDGVDGFDKMSDSVNKQGAAADLAGARMQGLGGAFEGLKSVVETTLLNAVQPFMDTMEGLVRKGADLAGTLDTLDPSLKNAAIGFGLVLAVAGPVLLAMAGLATVLGFVLSPLGLIVLGLASLAAWLASSPEHLAAFQDAAQTAFGWLKDNLWEPFKSAADTALGWIETTGLPAVEDAASTAFQWLKDTDWLGYRADADAALGWIKDTALPGIASAASTAFAWVRDVGWPTFQADAQTALDWLSGTALPAVETAGGTAFAWITDVGWPTFSTAAYTALAWLHDTVLPMIEAAAGTAFAWVRDTGWPGLQAAAQGPLGWLKDTALPGVQAAAVTAFAWVRDTAWPQFTTTAQGGLGWLQTTGLPAVEAAASKAFTWLSGTAWPGFQAGAQGALGWLGGTALPAIGATAAAAFQWITGSSWPGFQALAQGALGWLSGTALPAVQRAVFDVQLGFSELASGNITTGIYALGQAFGINLLPAMQALQPVLDFLRPRFDGLVDAAQRFAQTVSAQLQPILQALQPLLDQVNLLLQQFGVQTQTLAPLTQLLGTAARWLAQGIGGELVQAVQMALLPLQALGGMVQTLAPLIGEGLVLAVGGLLTTLRGVLEVLNLLAPIIGGAIVLAIQTMTAAVGDVNLVVQKMSDLVKEMAHGDWQAAWQTVKQVVLDIFVKLPADLNAVVGPAMLQVGKDLVTGLIQGITDNAPSVGGAIAGVAQSAVDAAKHMLGIASPSAVFAEMGDQSVQGYADGVKRSRGVATSEIQALAAEIASAGDFEFGMTPSGGYMVDLKDAQENFLKEISLTKDQFDTLLNAARSGGPNALADLAATNTALAGTISAATDMHAGMLQAEDGSWVPASFYDPALQNAALSGSAVKGALGPPATTINNYGHTINAPLINNPTVRSDADLDHFESVIFDAFDKGESGALSTRGHSGGASGGSGGGLGLPSPPLHFTVPA